MINKKYIAADCLFMMMTLAVVFLVNLFLVRQFDTKTMTPMIFVLGVFLVSWRTQGYFFGIAASLLSVLAVNWAFTYPYWAFDLISPECISSAVVMLIVSTMTGALTTRLKQQEKLKAEAEKERMRGNLLRAVSHDIRTPLTSIVGSASALIENEAELSSEMKTELVQDIRSEAQWLIRIVENLLSVTRIDSDKGIPKIKMQDELVEEIISSGVMKFKKRFPDIKVSVRMPEELVMVPMDGILVEQVLVNLLENAAIHGKCTTEIVICVQEEDTRIRIAVEDNGVGIRESALPKIFDGSMQSEEGKESDAKRNMGIGLSVCRTIVKAHKGSMKAENKETGGARFTFWLPK